MGNPKLEDEAAFLTERCCLSDLVDGLKSSCPCGLTSNPESVVQVRPNTLVCTFDVYVTQRGHVTRLQFSCQRCHKEKRT